MRSRHALYGDYQNAVDNFERSLGQAIEELAAARALAVPGISTPPEVEARIAAFVTAARSLGLGAYLRDSVIPRLKGAN